MGTEKPWGRGCPHGFRLNFNLSYLPFNRYNLAAVWCIDLERTTVHDKKTLLVINCEEGDGVGVFVDAGNMLVIREDGNMLREVTTDWQYALHIEKSILRVTLIQCEAVVSSV